MDKIFRDVRNLLFKRLFALFCLELEDIVSTLHQFYAGLVIFITGGSGFLGKLLLLKLLQLCLNIGGIIMCLRMKRGQRLFDISQAQ
jgi:hypothetical protein